MTWRIPLADIRLSPLQKQRAVDVLDSGWLSMGPETARFEEQFAAASGATNAICVSSATAGLILTLAAAGVGPGDEVIVPSLTFVADANAVRVLGASVVFADISAVDRPLVDIEDILRKVTPKTRAILIVHYGGYLANREALAELRSTGITLIEDGSHIVGPIADNGDWFAPAGDMAVFSFFANKNLGVGEGGMITTGDPLLIERLRLLRSHGMTTGTWDRHCGHASDYDVVLPGWNFRPTELSAALGSAGLDLLPEHNASRRRLLTRYHESFNEAGSAQMTFTASAPTAAHLAVAVLPAGYRPSVREALAAVGIQSSFHYPPIHRFTAYAEQREPLPQTDRAADCLVTLPLHPWLREGDVDEIVRVVTASLR